MGLESPMLGKGWGLFENFYPFYQGPLLVNFENIRSLRTHANNAHNEILEIFSQLGLVGLGIYVWLFAVLFAAFIRYCRVCGPEGRYWTAPYAAAVVGMLADNMFNVSLHFAVPAMIFWWLLGAFSKKLSGSPEEDREPWRKPVVGAGVSALMILLCAAGMWYWSAQFMREMHYFRGFKAMRRNDFSGAAAELKKAYDSHGREVNNNYELANAYVRTGDFPAAKWAYQEALNSNAGYDEIYFNLGIVQKRLGETEAALSSFAVSAFINPLSAATFGAMSEIYVKYGAGSAKRAVEALSLSAKIFPGDANTLNTLGYFYTLLRDFRAAKEVYGRGIRANPDNEMLIRNLAGVAGQLGVKNDPDVIWLRSFQEVQGRLAANDFSPAARDKADALVRMEPGNPNALTLRARMSYAAGDGKSAKEDLLCALRARPQDNTIRSGLAIVYEKEGDFEAARREWRGVLQAEPDNAAVAQRLKELRGK
jgi:Flp pilus assembly protein TadD